MSENENSVAMDVNAVMRLLPHRYPFLLIDRVTDIEPGKTLHAYKNVSFNEPFFQGHFPIKPVMPGVLILEALAQATGLLAMKTEPESVSETSLYYVAGFDKARFKRVVVPGDKLDLVVEIEKVRRGIWVFKGAASVDGQIAAQAEIMCTSREV